MDKLGALSNIPSDLVQMCDIVNGKNAMFVIRHIQLTPTTKITTVDVKLHPYKEDTLYIDEILRTLIPRGCCFVFLNDTFVHALYGHTKFGYIDDYVPTHLEYDKIVFRRKENGECAHWSGFIHDNVKYEMYGSKNVHLVVRTNNFDEDIKLYNDNRYLYATKIAYLIRAKIDKNSQLNAIVDYFISTKYTFCAECCCIDSQHLVKYDKSEMLFFAITGKRKLSDSLVKISPATVDNIFKLYELSTVAETVVVDKTDTEQLNKMYKYFETQLNSEGAVVYYTNGPNTVFTYKHKNYDYIFKRALREKMRAKASTTNIIRRLENLHITHENHKEMLEWGLQFNAYYRSLSEEMQSTFFENWNTWFEKFNKLSEEEITQIYDKHIFNENSVDVLNVMMFTAIPGSGKSFVARILKELLSRLGINTVHLEQDMFYIENDKKRMASKTYEKEIGKAMNNNDVKCIILTKSNHNINVRKTTYNTLSKCARRVNITYVTFNCDDGIEKMRDICVDRIMNRGFAHNSLYGKPKSEIYGIVTNTFVNGWEPLTKEEKSNNVITLNIEDDKNANVMNCVYQMEYIDLFLKNNICENEITELINNLDEHDKKFANDNKKKFDATPKKVLYDCITINTSDIIDAINNTKELSSEIKLNNLNIKDEFHVTLNYYGGKLDTSLDKFNNDDKHKIKIVAYAVDIKAAACMVELPPQLNCEKIPHITLALASPIKASYSSTLIEYAISSDTLINIEPVYIEGITKRILV